MPMLAQSPSTTSALSYCDDGTRRPTHLERLDLRVGSLEVFVETVTFSDELYVSISLPNMFMLLATSPSHEKLYVRAAPTA